MAAGAGGLVLLGLVLALGACKGTPAPSPTVSGTGKLAVLTTIYPLEYLAQRVGGQAVSVVNVVPAGVEPHDWEPSPRDMTAIQRAGLFIYNGAGFEPWAGRVVAALSPGRPVVVDATEGLSLRRGGQDGMVLDPHVWLDPLLYLKQGELVGAALTRADPANASVYAGNLEGLRRDLERLVEEMGGGLASCQRRTVVVPHAAFGYLAERFNLRQLPITGLSPEAEPSPGRLSQIAREVKEAGATYIFFETLVSPALAETIAREVGARTLVLNPLEGLTHQEAQAGKDYMTLMRENLANLRIALGCQ